VFILLGAGCSRPLAVPAQSAVDQSDTHQTPFHGDEAKPDDPNVAKNLAGGGENSAEGDAPFHDRESLPAGTLISVRLRDPISVGDLETSNTFEAVVVEPVVIEGKLLVPLGAAAAGRVESARTSKVKPNRGYVRLALASFRVEGMDVPIQTASLFARQFPMTDVSSSTIYLETGRRLTFRLNKPAYLSSPRAQAKP